jgi:hypothetical protein
MAPWRGLRIVSLHLSTCMGTPNAFDRDEVEAIAPLAAAFLAAVAEMLRTEREANTLQTLAHSGRSLMMDRQFASKHLAMWPRGHTRVMP